MLKLCLEKRSLLTDLVPWSFSKLLKWRLNQTPHGFVKPLIPDWKRAYIPKLWYPKKCYKIRDLLNESNYMDKHTRSSRHFTFSSVESKTDQLWHYEKFDCKFHIRAKKVISLEVNLVVNCYTLSCIIYLHRKNWIRSVIMWQKFTIGINSDTSALKLVNRGLVNVLLCCLIFCGYIAHRGTVLECSGNSDAPFLSNEFVESICLNTGMKKSNSILKFQWKLMLLFWDSNS